MIYLLLRGVEGTAARVSRIALVPFVIFYGTWEVLQGIGVGNSVNERTRRELFRATGADPGPQFSDNPPRAPSVSSAASEAYDSIAATIAAAIALYRHARRACFVAILLAISGFLITAHPPPYGPLGLILFIAAVLLYV